MGDHRLPTRAKRGSHTAFLTQACMFSPVNLGFQHTPALTYPLPFRKAGTALASSLLCSASVSLGGELVSETGKAGQSIDPAVHCQAGLQRARQAHTPSYARTPALSLRMLTISTELNQKWKPGLGATATVTQASGSPDLASALCFTYAIAYAQPS